MPLNDQAQAVVDQIKMANMPPIPSLSPFNARMLPTVADAARAVVAKHPVDRATTPMPMPVGKIEHRTIPGKDDDILLRVYTPKDGDGPFPVLVYFHGGGFVLYNLDVYDSTCRSLTNLVGCVTVSVAYHQAPEHPFPAAVEDAFAAYRWTLAHAAELNGDPERVAVAGESAGGNLAAVTSLMARDQGVRLPVYQLLVYPMTNYAFDTPSYQANERTMPLNKHNMMWFWNTYLKDKVDGDNPYASPLRARDLSGLPPAMVITDEFDPLWSEGAAYAKRLDEAGVPVVYRHYDGVMHEFFSMGAAIDTAKQANKDAADQLKQAFSAPVPARTGAMRAADRAMAGGTTPRARATTTEPARAPLAGDEERLHVTADELRDDARGDNPPGA